MNLGPYNNQVTIQALSSVNNWEVDIESDGMRIKIRKGKTENKNEKQEEELHIKEKWWTF